MAISNRLEATEITIDKLMLDPNNPRLFEDRGTTAIVPDDKISRKDAQASYLEHLKAENFGIRSLKQSILEVGYLPMDRIVVRGLSDGNFVVIEGNRRIAALKWLVEDERAGELDLPASVKDLLKRVPALILSTDPERAEVDRWLLQGVRHVSGIKSWGALEEAMAVEHMVEELGMELLDVANALGISPAIATRKFRAIKAYHQFQQDPEFSEFADPKMYSYFEEAVAKPAIRDFLGWSEEALVFENKGHRDQFYSWIVPGENAERKLPMAIDVRKLRRVIESSNALVALDTEGGNIDTAVSLAGPPVPIDWHILTRQAIEVMNDIPIAVMEKPTEEDLSLLRQLATLARRRLKQLTENLKRRRH